MRLSWMRARLKGKIDVALEAILKHSAFRDQTKERVSGRWVRKKVTK